MMLLQASRGFCINSARKTAEV